MEKYKKLEDDIYKKYIEKGKKLLENGEMTEDEVEQLINNEIKEEIDKLYKEILEEETKKFEEEAKKYKIIFKKLEESFINDDDNDDDNDDEGGENYIFEDAFGQISIRNCSSSGLNFDHPLREILYLLGVRENMDEIIIEIFNNRIPNSNNVNIINKKIIKNAIKKFRTSN